MSHFFQSQLRNLSVQLAAWFHSLHNWMSTVCGEKGISFLDIIQKSGILKFEIQKMKTGWKRELLYWIIELRFTVEKLKMNEWKAYFRHFRRISNFWIRKITSELIHQKIYSLKSRPSRPVCRNVPWGEEGIGWGRSRPSRECVCTFSNYSCLTWLVLAQFVRLNNKFMSNVNDYLQHKKKCIRCSIRGGRGFQNIWR